MHFEFSPEDAAFRLEVRGFLQKKLPRELARRTYVGAHPPRIDDVRWWQRALYEQGWGAPHWPKEYGGTDWSPVRQHIFMEELYDADALDYGWQALHMVGPVIIEFGSQWQKQRFLPKILSGEEFWCQGFSEPNAGSDLTSLKTRAQLDGDRYVVNGQKIWTSDASMSQWGFFLVRTANAERPQSGISFLLVDMATPGITVRPIVSIDGGNGLNEVFLDDVRVPKENLVGEPGMGWTYAQYLLKKERITSAFIYFNKRELEKAKEIARHEKADGVPLIETPAFGRRIAEIETDTLALEWSVLRLLAEEKPRSHVDAEVSALKIRGSQLQQRVTELQVDALGLRAVRFYEHDDAAIDAPDAASLWPSFTPGRTNTYFFHRAATIYGGALQVQKNIIAKRAFEL